MAPTGNVLVLGDNDRAGLTTVRSLGRAGLQVHLVASEASSITRRSRYVHRRYSLGRPLDEPDRFAARVLDLVRRRRFDLAVPTSDKTLLPLMARRLDLETYTRFAAPDQAGFEATYYKHITVAVARRLGECIDCGVCEPECPVEAIIPDSEPPAERWLELNRQYASTWPNITRKKSYPADADEFKDVSEKFDKYFSPNPGGS